jgi:hypothetical protein
VDQQTCYGTPMSWSFDYIAGMGKCIGSSRSNCNRSSDRPDRANELARSNFPNEQPPLSSAAVLTREMHLMARHSADLLSWICLGAAPRQDLGQKGASTSYFCELTKDCNFRVAVEDAPDMGLGPSFGALKEHSCTKAGHLTLWKRKISLENTAGTAPPGLTLTSARASA